MGEGGAGERMEDFIDVVGDFPEVAILDLVEAVHLGDDHQAIGVELDVIAAEFAGFFRRTAERQVFGLTRVGFADKFAAAGQFFAAI